MKKVFRKLFRNFNSSEIDNEELKLPLKNPSQSLLRSNEGSLLQNNHIYPHVSNKLSKLNLAVLSEHEADIRKYAVKRINDKDNFNQTALHLAVIQGNANIVKLLLELNAHTEIVNNEGHTPFLKAVETGNVELVKIFLNEKINKEQVDFNGNTALHLSVLYGFLKITELLIKNGAPVNVPNKAEDYPLHLATQNESLSIVKLLLENGADVNLKDMQKRTPLFIAIQIENLCLIELFIKFGANRDEKDMNGLSVKDCALRCNNSNVKAIFKENKIEQDNNETDSIVPVTDEDSQISELSCVLPPVLKSPRSWNILQKGLPAKNENESGKRFYGKNYERSAKSLSFDISNDSSKYIKNHNRCNSMTFCHILNNENNSALNGNSENNNAISMEKDNALDNQLENCQKALEKLSLDVLHNKIEKQSNTEFKSCERNNPSKNYFDCNTSELSKENLTSVVEDFESRTAELYKSKHSTDDENPTRHFYFKEDLVGEDSNHVSQFRDVTISIKNVSSGSEKDENYRKPFLTQYSVDDKFDECSDSSEEDLPFWKNSSSGGYFTESKTDDGEINEHNLENLKSFSSDEDSENEEQVEASQNIMLSRLKQVTRENEDLETETAVLREATEKLKYDLANCRQVACTREISLAGITTQITQMDTKYSKAMEKINSFQLCVNNLEQEVAHLKRICDKSYRMNQQLMQQIKELVEENKEIKSGNNQADGRDAINISKIQSDILFWKTMYEKAIETNYRKSATNSNIQIEHALNWELNRISDKIKDCLSKTDLAVLQDQQQIFFGKTLQQILNEADNKLQSSLTEMKKEMHEKLKENDTSILTKVDSELKLMEYENTKQRLLLEVSKLTSILKDKENEEQNLKSQLSKFQDEIRKSKDEKRQLLLRKSFEDVRNFPCHDTNESKFTFLDSSLDNNLSDKEKLNFECYESELKIAVSEECKKAVIDEN